MNYGLINKLELVPNTCLVLGIFYEDLLTDRFTVQNESLAIIQKMASKITKVGDSLWQSEIDEGSLLIIQCGKKNEFTAACMEKRLATCVKELKEHCCVSATFAFPAIIDQSPDWQLEHMTLQLDNALYQFLDFKTLDPKPISVENINFYLPDSSAKALDTALAVCTGIRLTRNLGDLPANICTPTYLADQALILSKDHQKIKTTVLSTEDMQKLGMNTLLAVAQGSAQPPKFIEMHYQNGGDKPTYVLVGKGITFDSGGISIKPACSMEEMKYDMVGAASVLGAMKACALLDLPINLVGLIPSAENMPGGKATRPGDIVTSMAGITVEIVNTDAEGRLILADALTYAERFNPEFVIDIATLTGAMVIALGFVTTGFMTNDDPLAALIEKAAKESEDKAWRLPLDAAYDDILVSPLADLVNATFDRIAGSITAARFLSKFTSKYRWAHLDIAGTAWVSGKNRNATGRPVPLLTQILRNLADAR